MENDTLLEEWRKAKLNCQKLMQLAHEAHLKKTELSTICIKQTK